MVQWLKILICLLIICSLSSCNYNANIDNEDNDSSVTKDSGGVATKDNGSLATKDNDSSATKDNGSSVDKAKEKLARLKYKSFDNDTDYFFVRNNNVCKRSKDTGKEEVLFDMGKKTSFFFGVDNEKVLYYVFDTYDSHFEPNIDFTVMKYDLNKKSTAVVFASKNYKRFKNDYNHKISFQDNIVYIQMSWGFYAFDIEKSTLKRLSRDVREYQIENNYLYYIDSDSSFYKYDLDTNKQIFELEPSNSINYTNFIVIDDKLFFYSRAAEALYLYDDKAFTLIDEAAVPYALCSDNGLLYYIAESGKEYLLYSYDYAEQKRQKLTACPGFSTGLEVIDGYVFYYTRRKFIYLSID